MAGSRSTGNAVRLTDVLRRFLQHRRDAVHAEIVAVAVNTTTQLYRAPRWNSAYRK
jgi:hypothetical protein